MTRRLIPAALVCSLVLALARLARADTVDPRRSEAAERFDRAIRLVNSGDLSGGLAEFLRADALVPSAAVAYNLGLVYAQLNRPVEAKRAIDRALAHPNALEPADTERARELLHEQGDKIGHVELSASVKTGVVEVDNVEVANLPLTGPLDVSSGPHVVGVISPGYAPARREVVVAGRDVAKVQLELIAIEGLLAHIGVECLLQDADVFVDEQRVGKTPLDATVTVAPGAHRVEIRRAGYSSVARSIVLQDGARGDLSMTPRLDPSALDREGGYLAIKTSETQSVVSVDGGESALLTGPLHLPAGTHRLHLERGGFLAAERDVNVPLGKITTVSVSFEPTPDTRAKYVSSAESRRIWSWATLGAGAVVAAGGAIFAVVEQGRLPGARRDIDAVNADSVRFSGGSCDFSMPLTPAQQEACATRLNDATSRVDSLQTGRTVGWIVASGGGALIVTGTVLLLTSDDPHKYDQSARGGVLGSVRVMPAVGLRGGFIAAVATF
jgi:hypothetical protein